jgi:hypothetical protein
LRILDIFTLMKKNKPADKKHVAAKQETAPSRPVTAAAMEQKPSFLSSFSAEEKISLGLLICIILMVILIRSNFLSIPFERDEGAYSYYGKLLLHGKIPYKEFYEQKFPGIFYFYAFMVSIFGDTVRGMHTGFIFLNVATIIIIYFTARNLFSAVAGVISAATFAILSLSPFLSGFTVQSEHGVAFFMSLGLLFYSLFNKTRKWQMVFFMGLAFGCAFMVKTNAVFFVLWGGFILILDFFLGKEHTFKDLVRQVLVYSGGTLIIIAILFLIMIAKGAFNEMLFWVYYIPKKYVGKIPLDMGIQFFKYNGSAIIQNYTLLWVHSLLAIVVCFLKPIGNKMKAFGITLLLFSFFTIVPGLYFYGHYWIMTIPGLSIAAGLTYYSIIAFLQQTSLAKFKGLKYVYLTIFGIFIFSNVSAMKEYYFQPDYETVLRAVYGNNPFPEAWEISEYINTNSKPEDGLVVVGSEPEIYFYTKKNCPSRHAYFSALVESVPEHKEWQREFSRDVEKAKPRYFIFFNHKISLLVQANTDHYVFDWMKQYIDSNYKLIGLVDMIDGQHSVYKWKEQLNNYRPVAENVVYIFERK